MELSEAIRKGRRSTLEVSGFELLKDLYWEKKLNRWAFHFSLKGDYQPSALVPVETHWFCTVTQNYPRGEISIYPANICGIVNTFHHQSYNSWDGKSEWRDGSICVATSLGKWGKRYFNTEPFEVSTRLLWHIRRCKDWIEAAASGNLIAAGDPFEMPSFPQLNDRLFVFNESKETFGKWEKLSTPSGLLHSYKCFSNPDIWAMMKFDDEIVTYEWGKHIREQNRESSVDIWVMLKKIPVIEAWQIPVTWKELFQSLTAQGIDLSNILYKQISKAKKILPKFLFLGFPVPANIGGETNSIYWLATHLPVPPKINGFRKRDEAYFQQQHKSMFADGVRLKWTNTENWNYNNITTRGKMENNVRKKRILLAGAGSVGSLLAELLIRLGCNDITLLDRDVVAIGNLARHTLSMDSVRIKKAEALADKLNKTFPHANVTYIPEALNDELNNTSLDLLLKERDIIIDATADDDTIEFLSRYLSGSKKVFISISTGQAAKRLFCYMVKTEFFALDTEDFHQSIEPWLTKEQRENPEPEFPMEGIGCWHPIFPARADSISMLVAACINLIEQFVIDDASRIFRVIEKKTTEDGLFNGIEIFN